MPAPSPSAGTDTDEVRRILEERAAALAEVAEEPTCLPTVGLVLFRLGTEWYGARLEDVREISRDLVATRLPRVPDHVVGVTSIRGEILSVTDPARLLDVQDTGPQRAGRFESGMIVEAGGRVSVFVVDEVGDIVDVEVDALEPPMSAGAARGAEFVTASVLVGGRVVALLDVERMLAPLDADT